MTDLAIDWNASRVRAVLGAAGGDASPVPLDPPSMELALAIALDKAVPEVGSAALRMSRSAPHQVCQSFLPYLTDKPGQGPRWQAGRHVLDSHATCSLVWQKLQALAANADGIVLTVPDYLRPVQANALRKLGETLRLPILGSIPVTLAAALAAFHFSPAGSGAAFLPSPFGRGAGGEGAHPGGSGKRIGTEAGSCHRSVLILEVDEHALTLGWVKALADKAHLIESRSFPHLGLRVWNERLLDALSDLFVLEHRRDPRDVPNAEQGLFDQLDLVADAALENRSIQLGIQGREWFKHLLLYPEQTVQICSSLIAKVVAEAEYLLRAWPAAEWPPAVVLTHAAARLPGLVESLQSLALVHPAAETKLPQVKATAWDDADFGENLMIEDAESPIDVLVLAPEAPARAVHGLVEAFRTGELPRGHLETIVPSSRPHAAGIRQRSEENRARLAASR